MMDFHETLIVGRLGADPDLRYTPNGKAVVNMRIAVNEKWKCGNGEPGEHTEWYRVVAWGNSAESAARYLSKGDEALVKGRMRTHSYEAQDGSTRYMTELIARQVIFGRKANGNGSAPAGDELGEIDLEVEDLPF